MRFSRASIAFLFASLCTAFLTVLGGRPRVLGAGFCTVSCASGDSVVALARLLGAVWVSSSARLPDMSTSVSCPVLEFRVRREGCLASLTPSSPSATITIVASFAAALVALGLGGSVVVATFTDALARLGGILTRNRQHTVWLMWRQCSCTLRLGGARAMRFATQGCRPVGGADAGNFSTMTRSALLTLNRFGEATMPQYLYISCLHSSPPREHFSLSIGAGPSSFTLS